MKLDTLIDLPAPELPAGFRFYNFENGDDATWIEIQSVSDPYNTISPELFNREFAQDEEKLVERQLFVRDDTGRTVGTATAWLPEPNVQRNIGRLHWLAVIPTMRRRGLGSALICASLRRMQEIGYTGAYLTTASERANAIRLYNRFGFSDVSPGDLYEG